MGSYVVTAKGPSRRSYDLWREMGYRGSYEQYAKSAWNSEGTRIFIQGNLGEHCAECAAPSDILCDYPVGDGKTCDRSLCRDHAHSIGRDLDYCDHHHVEWTAFASTNAVMDQLTAITEGRVPPTPKGAND